MGNLNIKLADEHLKFLQSSTWALIKYRLLEYEKRLKEYTINLTRTNNVHGATLSLGKADGVLDSVGLIEGLNKEIMENTFDADAALHVIENKAGK